MNNSHIPGGVIPPMVTPILPVDNEKIDVPSTKKIVKHLLNGKVDGIFALGTCGEFAAFTNQSKIIFLEAVKEAIEDRVPMLIGITETSTEKSIHFYKDILHLQPFYLVASAPYYYVYSQSQLENYFLRIADSVAFPVVLYNIPQFNKNDIHLDTLLRLSVHPNIVGLKDSSGDFSRFQDIVHIFSGEYFHIYQGIENLSAVSLMIGADGLVPGLGNVVPSWFALLWDLAVKKSWDKMLSIQKNINNLAKIFSMNPWISGLKQALEELGLCSGKPHHPYHELSGEEKQALKILLQEAFNKSPYDGMNKREK